MTSIATSTWELVFWEHEGVGHAALRGPETSATSVEITGDSESFGITFSHGTSMPHLPISGLVDREIGSPHVSEGMFVLRGEEWEIPHMDCAEQFVQKLVRAGVLVRDPLVEEVVRDGSTPMGERTAQRLVVAATGLTRGAIHRIERARHAAALLIEGVAPIEVVHRVGYYDQPHLARSLQRFIGRTATQLRRGDADDPLSLLYKTEDPTRS